MTISNHVLIIEAAKKEVPEWAGTTGRIAWAIMQLLSNLLTVQSLMRKQRKRDFTMGNVIKLRILT